MAESKENLKTRYRGNRTDRRGKGGPGKGFGAIETADTPKHPTVDRVLSVGERSENSGQRHVASGGADEQCRAYRKYTRGTGYDKVGRVAELDFED